MPFKAQDSPFERRQGAAGEAGRVREWAPGGLRVPGVAELPRLSEVPVVSEAPPSALARAPGLAPANSRGLGPEGLRSSHSRTARLGAEEGLELEHLLESKKLVKCLLSYARCKPSDHEVLFQMLTIFTVRSIVDYSFLKQFYAQEVANGYRLADRKAHILKSTSCSAFI